MADEDYPTDSRSYKIIKTIGSGDNTVVIKAVCTPMNSSDVAIRIIESIPNPEDVRRESEAMKDLLVRMGRLSLPHPNILQPHCSFNVKSRHWVVMPFMSRGSLLSIIASSHLNGLPLPIVAAALKGVLFALLYLHNHSRLHMNIKAGNILVDSNGSVKLGDCWASSSILDFNMWSAMSTIPASGVVDKAYWVAPEVIRSCVGYTFKADIWGFGVTALELAYGRPPLSHLPLSKTMKMEISKRFRCCYPYNKTKAGEDKEEELSELFESMVGLCLNHDPSSRPTAEELLEHPFFKNCKEPDAVIKKFFLELPVVTNIKLKPSSRKSSEEEFEDVNHKRIIGWKFNKEGVELDPIFPVDDAKKEEGSGGIGDCDVHQILNSFGLVRDSVDDLLRKVDERIEFLGGEVVVETTTEEEKACMENEMKMLSDLENKLLLMKQQLVETLTEEEVVDLMKEVDAMKIPFNSDKE